MLRQIDAILRRVRAIRLRLAGVRIARNCWIQAIEVPRNAFDIQLAEGVALDRGVILLATGERLSQPRISIGSCTYVNRHTMIDTSHQIRIGRNCMIGPFCYITDHDHGTALGKNIQEQPLIGEPVVIEDDVWIGAHVAILKGVRISAGAVIGAGAVVTHNVAANAIVAGVPARQIGTRHA